MNLTNGCCCRLCDAAFGNGVIRVNRDLGIDVSKLFRESTDSAIKS